MLPHPHARARKYIKCQGQGNTRISILTPAQGARPPQRTEDDTGQQPPPHIASGSTMPLWIPAFAGIHH